MIKPQVGDRWEFRTHSGHKTKKIIKAIDVVPRKTGKSGRLYHRISWSHTPKARYINNMSVYYLLYVAKGRLLH